MSAAAIKRFEKAEEKAAKLLIKSSEAMSELYRAAIEADIPGVRGLDDNRVTLGASMSEYGHFLQGRVDARRFRSDGGIQDGTNRTTSGAIGQP